VPAIVAGGWTFRQIQAFEARAKKNSEWAGWDWEDVKEELIESRADDFGWESVDFGDNWVDDLINDFFALEQGSHENSSVKPRRKARKGAR
jgi:hypothetical protein